MTDGKAVKFTKEPSKEIRLFRKREPIIVPVSVDGNIDNITILPMTHSMCETSRSLEEEASTALSSEIKRCGFTIDDWNWIQSLSNREFDDSEISEEDAKRVEMLTAQMAGIDRGAISEVKGKRKANERVMLSECFVSVGVDGDQVDIDDSALDCIHPDILAFVVSKIKENSFLREGEIQGL